MLLYNVPKKHQGFTLIEMSVTAVVVGILAAIAVPNFLGLYNQTKVKDALAQVEGALKEGQKQAMRKGRKCNVEVDTTNNQVKNPATDGCLLSTRTLPENTVMTANITDLTGANTNQIIFSNKGNTDNDSTIVLYMNNNDLKKCLVISPGLGIIKTGDYTGDVSNPTASDCQTN